MAKKISNRDKKKAWDQFAHWVKVRDCIATSGLPFVGVCVTCDVKYHIRYLQAGHCFAGRRNGNLFHEDLVNIQCRRCNEILHGRLKKYRRIMEKKYGIKQVAEWEIEGKKVIRNRDMHFEQIAEKYRQKTNELLLPFGYTTYESMLNEE